MCRKLRQHARSHFVLRYVVIITALGNPAFDERDGPQRGSLVLEWHRDRMYISLQLPSGAEVPVKPRLSFRQF